MTPKQAKANRNNAKRSTGPKSMLGRAISSQNSIKHGLNQAVDFENNDRFNILLKLVKDDGYSHDKAHSVVLAILNHRRVMDAYCDIYTQPEEVDDSIQDISLAAIRLGLREMAKANDSEVTAYEIQSMARLVMRSHNERYQVKSVFSRIAYCHKLIRYQRNAIARLSKAIRSE
jgi:hypothetical protein